ncbi:hypothetical protein [Microbispora amethystogenes]|uniref:Uncharacterized protein n=1 Tax=Microbispora amethystogenes TaxID=1427754 RepID=A0ABQ4F8Y2_9ACTN|nr:hypothetical protein Mam01_14430 [Microbispora amethystogenes]
MAASRAALRLGGPALFLLCSCTPLDSDFIQVVNGTGEVITVSLQGHPRPFATLTPNAATSFYPQDEQCDRPRPDDAMVARTESGTTYTYGPPLCRGKTWNVGR